MTRPNAPIVGRGAHKNPPNRFDKVICEDDFEQLVDEEFSPHPVRVVTQFIPDDSQSIVSSNNSPDLSFRYSLNPYRGCSHGCSYCYARTYHEFLGMSGGLDFETKLLYTMLRLPGVVQEIFRSWLERELPDKASLVESRIRQIRGGELHDARFGKRMIGDGELAKQIRQTFDVFAKRYHLENDLPPLNTSLFRRPGDQRQRRLF